MVVSLLLCSCRSFFHFFYIFFIIVLYFNHNCLYIFLGQYYHVLTSTSLVVVSSRTEDYDARPVPAAGKKIVGFRSANMYVVPAYSNTRMNIHLYQDTSIKNYLLQGKS